MTERLSHAHRRRVNCSYRARRGAGSIPASPTMSPGKPTRFPGTQKPSQFRSDSTACRGLRTEFRPFSRVLRLKSPASLSPQNSVSRTTRWRGRRRGFAFAKLSALPFARSCTIASTTPSTRVPKYSGSSRFSRSAASASAVCASVGKIVGAKGSPAAPRRADGHQQRSRARRSAACTPLRSSKASRRGASSFTCLISAATIAGVHAPRRSRARLLGRAPMRRKDPDNWRMVMASPSSRIPAPRATIRRQARRTRAAIVW